MSSEVAFELERFEWVGEDQLEVVGRWQGLSGRRLARPLLYVDAAGHRRRLTAMPGGRPPSAEGELWKAVFGWSYGSDSVDAAELEVARSIVVDLPPPRAKRRVPGATSPSADLEQRRLREQVGRLESALAELRGVRDAADAHDAAIKAAEQARDAAIKEAEDARAERDAARAAAPVEAADETPAPDTVPQADHDEVVAERDRLAAQVADLQSGQTSHDDQHAALLAQSGALRSELGEAMDAQERLTAELRRAHEEQLTGERKREEMASELSQLRADLSARDDALERVGRELANAGEEAERRLAAERAITADVREKLAAAREEAQRALRAEAEETERLRVELGMTREEAERALATERAETSRLREELADQTTTEGDPTDGSGRRMYEAIARELERERTTVRNLRRELDSTKAQTAEKRRTFVSAATNGLTTTEETQVAATPAGRKAAAMAARTEAAERSPIRRADAARAAAAHRVPEHPQSTAGVWAVRAAAVVLVAVLLAALFVIITAVA